MLGIKNPIYRALCESYFKEKLVKVSDLLYFYKGLKIAKSQRIDNFDDICGVTVMVWKRGR